MNKPTHENGSGDREGRAAVLLLEDDPNIRQIFRVVIEPLGYELISAEDADSFKPLFLSAVAKVPKEFSRLACFLDIFVPGNGVQVFSFIKQDFPFVPVVFCSGNADIPMAVEQMKHGAHDFLQKPFSLSNHCF